MGYSDTMKMVSEPFSTIAREWDGDKLEMVSEPVSIITRVSDSDAMEMVSHATAMLCKARAFAGLSKYAGAYRSFVNLTKFQLALEY